jgi:hypothetical protein
LFTSIVNRIEELTSRRAATEHNRLDLAATVPAELVSESENPDHPKA